MVQFYPLQVSDIRQETADCVSVAFAIPETLQSTFQFIQGQYLTLRHVINGEEVRRSYSLCSSPVDKEWRVAIKKVPEGLFSTFANEELTVGTTLEAMPPAGKFYTALNATASKHYVAFAAGSGITPIMSILRTVLATEPNSRFTLFYGNQRTESIIFREQLENLKNEYLGRLSLHYLLSREHTGSDLFSGRLDADRCRTFCEKIVPPKQVDEYFLCGPEEMIISIRQTLLEQGAVGEQIHLELFGTATKAKTVRAPKATDKPIANVELQLDGNILYFDMYDPNDNLLDAALRHGADLPYACKGGVCCTCRTKIEEGEVEMAINYALEPDEVAAGYVLSCQAQPRSGKIRVNFDA